MIAEEDLTVTLVKTILSGDVHAARLWAASYPMTVAGLSKAQRNRVYHACHKWGIPTILN